MRMKSWKQLDGSHKCFILGLVLLLVIIGHLVLAPCVSKWNSSQTQSMSASHVGVEAILHIQHPTIQKINHNATTPTKNKFINQIGKASVYDFRHDRNVQIAPSIVIAQAIIESNWGQSPLYYKNNNAFGIKALKGQPSATYGTYEVYNGKRCYISAQFRAYKNVAQGIYDHNVMLRNKFIGKNHDLNYVQDARLLHANGYATDPSYAQTIIEVIDTYDLNRFDKIATK